MRLVFRDRTTLQRYLKSIPVSHRKCIRIHLRIKILEVLLDFRYFFKKKLEITKNSNKLLQKCSIIKNADKTNHTICNTIM